MQNNDASAEDRDQLAQVIRTTSQASDELLKALTWREEEVSKHPSAVRQAKRKRQLAKAARHPGVKVASIA